MAKNSKRSSKRQTTQYNHFQNVRNRLSAIYSHAIAFRLSHARILELRSELFQTNSYKRLTVYYRGYIRGMDDQLMADIWRNHVVWMLGPKDGPIRVVHTAWTAEMSQLARTSGALYGGHFWIDDADKPTDKAFTEYSCTNATKVAELATDTATTATEIS